MIIAFVILLLIAPSFAWSQTSTGTLSGVVFDQAHGTIADAAIVIVDEATSLKRDTTTNADGEFTFAMLPAGSYRLRATSEGFAPFDVPAVVVDGRRPVVLRVQLKVESLSEAVMVTALKREQRLQDVPASIVTASGDTIADLNAVGVTELDTIAPGLTFVTNPSRFGGGPSIALRGVSTQTQSAAVQDSVSIVIDGVPIAVAKAGAFPDLNDTARVEIMRGPQGTLFGKNASAGVISVTTKDPGSVGESEVLLGYSTYDTRTVRASLSGPIASDRVLGRLSVYHKSRDGFVENIFDGSTWEADEQTGFRSKLFFTPTSRDSFKVSGDFLEQSNDAGTQSPRAFLPGTLTPQYVRDALGSIAGPENDRINTHSLGDNRHRAGGAQFQWERAFGLHTLTALGAYRTFSQRFHQGTYAWLTPLDEGDVMGSTGMRQRSAEIRMASPAGRRLEYVAGLFALDNRVETALRDPDPGLLVVGTTTRTQRNYINIVDASNYAVFGDANVRVTDRVSLTGGLRWTNEHVAVDITGYPISATARRAAVPLGTTRDAATARDVSWKAGGQWRVDDDRMIYGSVATGFKGPGFNVNITAHGDAQPVTPETSTSVEGGIKSQFLDRRLTVNVSAFHSLFKDFQTQAGLIVAGNPNPTVRLLNAGQLRTRGIEVEVAAMPRRSTEFSMNATYIDGRFKEFRDAPCYPGQALTTNTCSGGLQDLSGTRLPNTPEWAVNAFARHDFAIAGLAPRAFVTLDYSWRGSVQWNNLGSPLGIEPGYGLWGASAGVRSANDRVALKVYGKNLADTFHTSGIAVATAVTHFLPPDYRRVVGIELILNYRKSR